MRGSDGAWAWSPSTPAHIRLPRCLQADKLDPREQAKMETREWVNDVVDRLTVRIEQFEYEMEEMQANLKKKAKPPPKLVQVGPGAPVCQQAAAERLVLACACGLTARIVAPSHGKARLGGA